MTSIYRFRIALITLIVACCMLPVVVSQQKKEEDKPTIDSSPADAGRENEKKPEITDDIKELKLKDWHPKSMLKVKETHIDKAAYPAIDVHNHLGNAHGYGSKKLTDEQAKKFVEAMNETGVATVVNLDGMWDDILTDTITVLDKAYPGRFLTFAQINFKGIDDEGWTDREVKRLRASFEAGAKGLKIHKGLGLTNRYKDGHLMPVDDPKLDPLWDVCGEYNKPVMIHVSDPAAFFTPLDQNNERWHELNRNPLWLFHDKKFPRNEEILAQLIRMIAKHPKTTFIGAHVACNAEDLSTVSEWLDKYPNLYCDIDARISELGRQPYSARRFLIKYQDRVMFGTDTPCKDEAYRIYYRFLESDDEYFDCTESHHLQGFWMIYGVNLPKDVLEKIYRTNALKILKVPNSPAAEK